MGMAAATAPGSQLAKAACPTTRTKTEDTKPKETIDDRVFVCQGKDAITQNIETWIMTINRTFDTITFWEVKNHTHYILKGRVEKG